MGSTLVRLTDFWERMENFFGPVYVSSVAHDHVLSGLGDRTIQRAIDDGVDPKVVWRAVCAAFDVPRSLT